VTRLDAIHHKTGDKELRLELEMEHQEKMDAWIANMKDDRKDRRPAKNK
jgi:hypothetical protein